MLRMVTLLLAVTLLTAPAVEQAQASDVGFDLNLHIGSRPRTPIVIQEPPLFLAPSTLGFHVAVGVPYDMVYIDGRYYAYQGGGWFMAPSYNGPWRGVGPKHLPPGLAKRRHTEIVRMREAEYARYRKDRQHYRGQSFRPDKGHGAPQPGHNGKGPGHGNKRK